jgi:hypothetical protein
MPGDVELLYETPETGTLGVGDDGRAFRNVMDQYSGPSLSGPVPRYGSGQRGIGGSTVELPTSVKHPVQDSNPFAWMDPSQLDGSSSVDAALIRSEAASSALDSHLMGAAQEEQNTLQRSGRALSGGVPDHAPEWLQAYMDAQDRTPDGMPAQHFSAPQGLDRVNGNKYQQEQDLIRQLKYRQMDSGVR